MLKPGANDEAYAGPEDQPNPYSAEGCVQDKADTKQILPA